MGGRFLPPALTTIKRFLPPEKGSYHPTQVVGTKLEKYSDIPPAGTTTTIRVLLPANFTGILMEGTFGVLYQPSKMVCYQRACLEYFTGQLDGYADSGHI